LICIPLRIGIARLLKEKNEMAVKVREKVKGSGDWWVFINHQGHRKAKHVGSKSAAKKITRLIEAKLAARELQIDTEQVPTFGELAKEWIEITVPATCKESTLEDYKLLLRKHILPVFKSKPVNRITRRDVKQFLLGKLKKGYSQSTVNYLKAGISGVLSVGVEGEFISVNPALNIGRIYSKEAPNQEITPFSIGELELLVDTIGRHWNNHYPLVLTLARTGMRIGEALAAYSDDSGHVIRRKAASSSAARRPLNRSEATLAF
jgi:integrase